MIAEIIVIISLVVIFIIFARRLPDVIKKSPKSENINQEQLNVLSRNPDDFWKNNTQDSKKSDIELADEYFEKGDFSNAERYYVKYALIDPDNVKIYNRLGIIYLEQKNFNDAKDAFFEALKRDNKKPSRHVNYGLACLNLRNFDEAIKSFEEAVKLDPNNQKYQSLLKDTKLKKRMLEKKK